MGDIVRGGVVDLAAEGTVGVGGTKASSGADRAKLRKGAAATGSVCTETVCFMP